MKIPRVSHVVFVPPKQGRPPKQRRFLTFEVLQFLRFLEEDQGCVNYTCFSKAEVIKTSQLTTCLGNSFKKLLDNGIDADIISRFVCVVHKNKNNLLFLAVFNNTTKPSDFDGQDFNDKVHVYFSAVRLLQPSLDELIKILKVLYFYLFYLDVFIFNLNVYKNKGISKIESSEVSQKKIFLIFL